MTLRGFSITAAVLLLMIVGGVYAQLQQSGGPGSSVTIAAALPAGANLIGKTGIDQTTPGTTNGVQVNAALPAGSNLIGKFGIDQTTPGTTNGVQINAAIPAGTNVIGHVITDSGLINVVPKTACGNTLASGSTLAAVPTSPTLLTSASTACVVAAVFFNTNGSSATVTLTDNTATPINAMLTFSIPANSNVIEDLHGGAFNLGVKWTASGTGVTGYVVAYQ